MNKSLAHQIEIKIRTSYLEAQSDSSSDYYVFAYTITIQNLGNEITQLLRRHWIITDANGNIQEVEGAGVIGKQPYLNPGEEFEYTSGVILPTPMGTMHGSYLLATSKGEHFNAEIPAFSLAVPNLLH